MGVALVDGRAISSCSWLIRPRDLDFNPYNVMIHGITPDMVRDKPEFPDVWGEVGQVIAGRSVLAHNAGFDMSVLRQTADLYGVSYPDFEYFCTRILSKKTWPDLHSYCLDIVADYCGIDFIHHDPAEDAIACARIALSACDAIAVADPREAADKLDFVPGRMFAAGYLPCRAKHLRPKHITPQTDTFDESHPFHGALVVFTGTLQSMVRADAMQHVVNVGGTCANSMSTNVDYLVVGDQEFSRFVDGERSGKMRRVEGLIGSGIDIEVVSEREFLQLLGGG